MPVIGTARTEAASREWPESETPALASAKSGRTMNGSSAVTLSGTASVIHQAAIQKVSPATSHAPVAMPAGGALSTVSAKACGPRIRPIRRAVMTGSAPPADACEGDYQAGPLHGKPCAGAIR